MRHEVEHTDLHASPPFNSMYAKYSGAVPPSSAIPYSGLDDVTVRRLTLATLHHRGSAILIMLLPPPFLRRISARLSKE
jgi:hypothetical protein